MESESQPASMGNISPYQPAIVSFASAVSGAEQGNWCAGEPGMPGKGYVWSCVVSTLGKAAGPQATSHFTAGVPSVGDGGMETVRKHKYRISSFSCS